MTKRTQGAWLAQFGLAAVLSFALSGLAASCSASSAEPKLGQCSEQRGACDFGCPPACADGGCARTMPAVLCGAPERIAQPTPERWLHEERSPSAPPPPDGVFHPPIG